MGLGPWAIKCYGSLCIHPLTTNGFIDPYITNEGWDQGDNVSVNTYHMAVLVVSACLPLSTEIHIHPRVRINNVSFSDDAHRRRPRAPHPVVYSIDHCERWIGASRQRVPLRICRKRRGTQLPSAYDQSRPPAPMLHISWFAYRFSLTLKMPTLSKHKVSHS